MQQSDCRWVWAAGKSEFGLYGVVGGMTVIALLAYTMRSVRGRIAAVGSENYCSNLLWQSSATLFNPEKILFLVAFVCAMNGHSAPAPVVWLSPFNWLGERERLAADRLVRTAFANRGQMIMLV